jgi:response regulator RpfG family c-di-GMP phosphodiesterase
VDRNYLVVAADGQTRQALSRELRKQGINVTLAESAAQAERVVKNVSIDGVLLETHLPDKSAEELRTKILGIRPDCRVIVLTGFHLVRNTPELLRFGREHYLVEGRQVFEMLSKPTDEEANFDSLPLDVRAMRSLFEVIDVLVGLLEIEHRFSCSSHQAMRLARATAEELGALDHAVDEVVLGTLLRDVGKAAVHDAAEPEEEESAEARNHRIRGHVAACVRLFEHIEFPWKAMPVIRHHHERYDGSGAPDGLRGREIPMGARIVAVVDAYLKLRAGRGPQAMDAEAALAELVRGAGTQFDPEVVEAFQRVIDKRTAGRRSKGSPRVVLADDDPDFRRVVKMRLTSEGLEVQEVEDYERCLEHLLKEPPDLALVSIDSDPAGAFQMLQELQQDDKLCRVPVAFVSQRGDRVVRMRALRQGVDAFLSKEDTDDLVAQVQSILVREAVRAEGDTRRSRRGISGRLDNLGLPDIVQTLTIGMKTACISLCSNDRKGKIWFDSGAPRHATAGKLKGDKAFLEMVRWTEGEFVIEHGVRTQAKTIERDSMFLLMEGLRLMDEDGDDSAAQAS